MTMKTVFAPAKVNLCLHVLGKRADGYHELAMLMQRIALFDRLDIELVGNDEVTVSCPGLDLRHGEQNIVEKAARSLLEHVDIRQGVSIVVEKNIPAAAGLGGGSSDAATVLKTLDQMLGLDLPLAELMELGLALGADVPFFLYEQTAWVTGVGEHLQPWHGLPPVSLVLVNPGIAVSTAWVFQNLGLTHSRPTARIPRFPERANDLVCLLHNDLEVVTCQHHPVITTIKERLLASGAKGSLMSGSGSTVFGIFDDPSCAAQAAQALCSETSWWVEVVHPL